MELQDFLKASYDSVQNAANALDQKITVLIAVIAIMFAATASFVVDLGCAWSHMAIWFCRLVAVISAASALSMLASLVCAGAALLPRRPDQDEQASKHEKSQAKLGQLFWAHSVADKSIHPSFDHYWRCLQASSDETRSAELAYEHMQLSKIFVHKFSWNRRAVKLFLVTLILWSATVILTPYVHFMIPAK